MLSEQWMAPNFPLIYEIESSMKRPGFLLCKLFILTILSTQASFSQEPEKEKFELVREDEEHDIYIYERWIKFPKSDPPIEAREVKGEFKIKGNIDDGLSLLKDEKLIYEWQKHVSQFEVFPGTDSTWFEYSYHDIPWPVSDQDHFLEYRVLENIPGEKVFIWFESVVNDKLSPVNEDATRMYIFGSWLFEKRDGYTQVTYRIVSKPMGIPRIFTDPVIRSNMMSTIKGYQRLIREKRK
jgi:hypothetical protein